MRTHVKIHTIQTRLVLLLCPCMCVYLRVCVCICVYSRPRSHIYYSFTCEPMKETSLEAEIMGFFISVLWLCVNECVRVCSYTVVWNKKSTRKKKGVRKI